MAVSARQTAMMPCSAAPSSFSRRILLAGMGACLAARPVGALGAGFSPLAAVRALRITAGPLAGAFTVAPLGVVNWYFGNLGLLPLAARLPSEVRAWLDLQIARYDIPRGTIADVEPDYASAGASPGIKRLLLSDSDDAYAGTLLALAARHDALGADDGWWNANVDALKGIARSGIRALQKPSGLTRTFRSHARPGADVAYLMDNCEVWSGLTAFAARLAARGDRSGAAVHTRAAEKVAAGIAGLFDPAAGAFRPSDSNAAVGTAFYPDATAQVFPELHGVVAPGLGQAQYDAGWAALGRIAPQWPALAYDSYPWLLLAAVAARRGAAGQRLARLQLAAARTLPTARLTINELGYWQRTADLLRG
ncbi:hypothetical protein AQZ52_06605 [Novosphingobium fuchskuhlense]|uniref:Uncharacterized protein n=2 Tax=Novosphingobium fuchskuhlense TaxID=1117702 RepID=A0A124JW18_9SPHN|nr:hypothetical protein AQZ52_06605 [Novosphingobium fuchskuhlense]